jgi:hypothetical protein
LAGRVSTNQIEDVVGRIVEKDGDRINQVMIVGGNDRNLDRGFSHHVDLAKAAERALVKHGRVSDISVHVATMPPANLDLLRGLCDLQNPHIMFNLEVWGTRRFEEIAPGKATDYGRARFLEALERLVGAIGAYRAHSLLIAGLEPPEMTLRGARALAELGVSPIINAYHSDRHSKLGLAIRPTYAELASIAVGLQELYAGYPIQPYWKGCGRNALDFEAAKGMFAGVPLDFG